jgi:hypothetical protein
MALTSHRVQYDGTFRQVLEMVLEEWKFCEWWEIHTDFLMGWLAKAAVVNGHRLLRTMKQGREWRIPWST